MEFQVINRNRNAVIPEGMFKLCGMEDAKLISMVQLNGGILLMPESVSTYQLLMLIDALNEHASFWRRSPQNAVRQSQNTGT